MKRGLRCFAVLCLLALAVPASAADDKKDDDKKPDPEKTAKDHKAAADKLITAGQLTGKVVSWDSSEMTLVLDCKLTLPDGIDQGVANTLASLQTQLIQAAVEKDLKTRINKVADIQKQIYQNQAKLQKYKTVDQKFEMQVGEDVKVRWVEPPLVFDSEKGTLIRRTTKELKELRGTDPRVPGYKAELSDLKADQMAMVVLSRKSKRPPKDKTEKPEKPSDKAGVVPEKDAPIKIDKKAYATLIVISPMAPDDKK